MQEIVFFTGNEGKLAEARSALEPLGYVITGRSFPFVEIQTEDQLEVLRSKYAQVKDLESRPFLVDDAGIYFRAYTNFPGVMTRHVFHMLGYAGLLRLLPPGEDRRAYFRGLLGFSQGDEFHVCEGRLEGEIVAEVRNDDHGFASFPFDRIFRPDGADATMADLRWERRLEYSYRVKALSQLVAFLQRG